MIDPEKSSNTDRDEEIPYGDGLLGILNGSLIGWQIVDESKGDIDIAYEFRTSVPSKYPTDIGRQGGDIRYRVITPEQAQAMIDDLLSTPEGREKFLGLSCGED